MTSSLPITAGAIATVIFAGSVLPMLGKAARTKDLSSYSRGHLVLANVGNLFYSVYVFDLPPGPVWALHTFYLASSALMLLWSLRYAPRRRAISTHQGVSNAHKPA
jgi:hypothetical protein